MGLMAQKLDASLALEGQFSAEGLADLFRLAGAASALAFYPRLRFADPSGKGPGVDDGDQFLDCRAEPHAQLDERASFRRSHRDTLGQLAPKNPVLGLEVLDVQDQVLLGRTGDEKQQWMNDPLHVGIMRKCLENWRWRVFETTLRRPGTLADARRAVRALSDLRPKTSASGLVALELSVLWKRKWRPDPCADSGCYTLYSVDLSKDKRLTSNCRFLAAPQVASW